METKGQVDIMPFSEIGKKHIMTARAKGLLCIMHFCELHFEARTGYVIFTNNKRFSRQKK